MKLLNLKKLIKSYKTDGLSAWAKKEDMTSMYMDDANDASIVLGYLDRSITSIHKDHLIEIASKHISTLDTIVREAVIVAIAQDTSNEWVKENLGWEVRV
jgi:hypothetical protein|tara:strand:- start:26 stop:325 length:300 start_codon:yes stop_codon:yes gene_type:complete